MNDNNTEAEKSLGVKITIGLLLGTITFIVIFGNVLVLLSPFFSRNLLKKPTYIFLISLAIADLLLGLLVLPFSSIITVTGTWFFGPVVCNLYVSSDVCFSTSSILHLLVITLDRYYAAASPFHYKTRMKQNCALLIVIVVWFVSVMISFPPIHTGLNTDDGIIQSYDDRSTCILETNKIYSLVDGIGLFFIPLIIIFVLYVHLILIVRKKGAVASKNSYKERRLVITIAVVLSGFAICWVPYFTIFTVGELFRWEPNPVVADVVLWLGYVNSSINPIIYGLLNQKFRDAFRKMLCLTCNRNEASSTYSMSRTSYYTTHEQTASRSKKGSKTKNGCTLPKKHLYEEAISSSPTKV
ncbi:5-hydroxytryptamine receptor 1D-like [Anneissia japonica]|uniref:5-hydroxytryptamine receptor 1D-like n=1 Tax=Anneissia japonica TaxID=1529436 RepID=UPI0014256E86|nr:5-hydroxytryptamine receptor 1D-like [Anneissia japonica]